MEVRHSGTALSRCLHLVDPAGGVALLVALQSIGTQIGFPWKKRTEAKLMLGSFSSVGHKQLK